MEREENYELVIRVRMPLAPLRERYPDMKYAWDVVNAEKQAITSGQRSLTYALADGMEHGKVTFNNSTSSIYVAGEIRETLRRKVGDFLNEATINKLADGILETLGYGSSWDDRMVPAEGQPQGADAELANAVKALLNFRPEHYEAAFCDFAASTDWRASGDPDEQRQALNDPAAYDAEQRGLPVHVEVPRKSDPTKTIRKRVIPNDGPMPFLSQAVYYPVLDKEDGRTLNARLRAVREALGLEDDEGTSAQDGPGRI